MIHHSKYPAINTQLAKEDKLFAAVMTLDKEQISELKSKGVTLTEEIKDALIHGPGRFHPNNPTYYFWDRFCCDFGELPPKEFAEIITMLRKEADSLIFYNPVLWKRCYNCLTDPVAFEAVLLNFNLKRLTKADLMKIMIDADAADCLPLCEKSGWLKKPEVRDELIEYSGKGEKTECTAWLLAFKNRTADLGKEQARAERKAEKELNADPNSPAELKKLWKFKKQEDGTLIITSYIGERKDIVVPEKIGEDTVAAIGESAFSPHAKRLKVWTSTFRQVIKTVTLPSTVTSIGERAFFKCLGLVNVVVPDSVVSVGDKAFFGCERLTVTVGEGSCAEKHCQRNNIAYKYKD